MDVTTALRTRRSTQHLSEPAPCDTEFGQMLEIAALAPDHGRLRPWRWVLLRGEDRARLGERLGSEVPDNRAEALARKPLRAPLLATLVLAPQASDHVPEWEQLSAATGVAHGLMLLLHERGYGSIWRTGDATRSAAARDLLGVEPGEELLGWLYIGTPEPGRTVAPRPRLPVSDKMSALPEPVCA